MGVFDAVNKFAAKTEINESKDEILIGEIVRAMSRSGMVPDQFRAGEGLQTVRFRTTDDPVLSYLQLRLNRHTGSGRMSAKLVGSKATLTMVGIVQNKVSDPDDLIAMWKTDAANVFKMPMLGQMKLDHRVTSVTATTKINFDIDDYVLGADPGGAKLQQLLQSNIGEVRNALAPYNRDDPGFN